MPCVRREARAFRVREPGVGAIPPGALGEDGRHLDGLTVTLHEPHAARAPHERSS